MKRYQIQKHAKGLYAVLDSSNNTIVSSSFDTFKNIQAECKELNDEIQIQNQDDFEFIQVGKTIVVLRYNYEITPSNNQSPKEFLANKLQSNPKNIRFVEGSNIWN